MNFMNGFKKIAGEPIGLGGIGKSLLGGLRNSGSQTVKDALKPSTAVKHVKDAVNEAGGLKKSFTTQKGREALAKGVGRAAPSAVVAGGYAAAAKKVYNKATEDSGQQGGYY